MPPGSLPLAGLRILDYSQFVAGPLAATLLADLGADVIKVESPTGDAYRHYEPLGDGESRRFYALNRGKRSVVCDLKSTRGRAVSRALIASADAVVHNMPPDRAVAFGLDADSVRAVNPTAVVTVVSAFGSDGPQSGRIGYDIVAQAYSGLLMADARAADTVPRRSGGIPYSDITAGLLACVSVLAGLAGRSRESAPHLEVSLLGAALATQVQDFVRTDLDTRAPESAGAIVTATDLEQVAQRVLEHDELEPYYRCYEAADGFFALACLNVAQRRRVLVMLGLQDPWVENPQLVPSSAQDRATRVALSRRFAEIFAGATAAHWLAACVSADVPAGEVRLVHQLFDDEQVRANGLVQQIEQERGGSVAVLGNLFKINGTTESFSRPAPRLGEHTESILTELDLAAPFPQLDDAELRLARHD
ncbi:MAG: CaiB/BaiF CoA transferase family protein [Geodermatophilaceae bacterium]